MINLVNMSFGSDPEGFLTKGGAVIGSERVIPQRGLPGVVRDGIQFELHPSAAYTIHRLAQNIGLAFAQLKRAVDQVEGVEISFDPFVEVSRAELDSLSDESRLLGCMPSLNFYEERPITVNPKTYRKRSAGGHAHFGIGALRLMRGSNVNDERHGIMPLFDLFVGIPTVLFDRSPFQAERRENYGRAGEYRLPTYGIEYRPPSNFWFHDYSLMHMVFGMGQVAVSIAEAGLTNPALIEELANTIDIRKMVLAIDTNDYKLARSVFDDVRPFIVKHVESPLNAKNIDKFLGFSELIEAKGIESVFPKSRIVDYWINRNFVDLPTFLETL